MHTIWRGTDDNRSAGNPRRMLNSGLFHGMWGYDFSSVGRPREVGVSLNYRF